MYINVLRLSYTNSRRNLEVLSTDRCPWIRKFQNTFKPSIGIVSDVTLARTMNIPQNKNTHTNDKIKTNQEKHKNRPNTQISQAKV